MPRHLTTASFTLAERRARLARRHHLAMEARSRDPVEVARDLVGLHATDPASIFLAVAARTSGVEAGGIERAMYDDRTLVRMLGMRRTLFVFPTEMVPVAQAACTRAIAVQMRRRYEGFIKPTGVAKDIGKWLRDVEASTLAAVRARGEASASELSRDEPRLRQKVMLNEGKSYGGPGNITTWVLALMAADGRIVRGRPAGASWHSTVYRYSPTESWLSEGLREIDKDGAQAELIRRYLRSFGPASEKDVRWWTGLTAGEVRPALAAIGATAVDIEGTPGLALADDLEPTRSVKPWAAFLPSLDPTVMGWTERDWYLGDHGAPLFDRNGNAGPSIWWNGRIVGGWAWRKDGTLPYRLLEDVGREAEMAIATEAERIRDWIGPVTFVPRFPTPLQRELAA
ncbi:MAG TPA: winged helix DNA-binding domain-containing protein [Candidatus Dormibacteraeota bacterium]|jgi:hypothetical protein|nr:winged helix DNA-binding domain-containing protein [Candidatus Dormibacteraeota bacterium]